MTKLQAIQHLEQSFKHLPEFKKTWADYIELCIIEELENAKLKIPKNKLMPFLKSSSDRILRLFNGDWWENQEGIK